MFENTDGWKWFGRSAIRLRIMAVLALNPTARYHLREVARLVDTSAGTASRELGRLVESGFIDRTREGRQVYFQIRPGGIWYESPDAIMRRTLGPRQILKREIGDLAGVKSAVIFGSYVSGRMRDDSDIDLLVIGGPDRDELTERLERAQKDIGRQVKEVVMDEHELAERRSRRDGFISSVDDGRTISVLP